MASLIVEQLGIEVFSVLSTCNGTYDELVRFCNLYHLLQSFFRFVGVGTFFKECRKESLNFSIMLKCSSNHDARL